MNHKVKNRFLSKKLEKIKRILLAFIYIGFLIYIFLKNTKIGGNLFCKADYLVNMMAPLNYFVVIVVPLVLHTFATFRTDFILSGILRYDSWKEILKKQEYEVLVLSICYALFLVVWNWIIFEKIPIYNWNQIESYFYYKTDSVLKLHYSEVFIAILIMSVIRNFVIQNIVLIVWWQQKSPFIGILLACGIVICEIAKGKFMVLCNLITPTYYIWQFQDLRVKMVIGVSIYLILFCIGYSFILKKKEV